MIEQLHGIAVEFIDHPGGVLSQTLRQIILPPCRKASHHQRSRKQQYGDNRYQLEAARVA
jgi:hypothetical protein